MRDFDLSPYARSTVGFDHLFGLLERAADVSSGYPPYNIERSDETHYRISLAVAGFREKDLNVETRDGVLVVSGNTEDGNQTYLYRGIAGRQFERRFQLAEHVEVRTAKLENGLLHIDLERIVPKEKNAPPDRDQWRRSKEHRRVKGRLICLFAVGKTRHFSKCRVFTVPPTAVAVQMHATTLQFRRSH